MHLGYNGGVTEDASGFHLMEAQCSHNCLKAAIQLIRFLL